MLHATLKPRHTSGAFFLCAETRTPQRPERGGVSRSPQETFVQEERAPAGILRTLTYTEMTAGRTRSSGILLLAVFLGVSLSRFFGVISGMDGMTACGVSMMRRFLVMPTVVMLRCFSVVSGSVGVMLGSLPMMLSRFLRHSCPPCCDNRRHVLG